MCSLTESALDPALEHVRLSKKEVATETKHVP